MKVKYVGAYTGEVPWLGRIFTPGEIAKVSSEVGERLLTTAQFVQVREPVPEKKKREKPEGGE